MVLPFISMVTEKTKHLQRIVAPYNRGRPKRQRIKASRNTLNLPIHVVLLFSACSYV